MEDLKSYGPDNDYADAIVVLTGGNGRTEAGLELLRQGRSGVLILSGVNANSNVDSIFPNDDLTELERLSIVLEKHSKSTIQNAVEVSDIVEQRRYRSIILLTSSYHIKRAEYIFDTVLPGDVDLFLYPVENTNYSVDEWYSGRSSLITMTEFVKYYWFYMKFNIEDSFGLVGY